MAILKDDNYVDKAEKAIKSLNQTKDRNNKNRFFLTTTKIRNLLNLTSNLFDESKVREYKELADKIAYLRVQFVYQAGREPSVKDLVRKAEILAALKEINNKESLQRFCRYMEALVAYFRFYGGEDS
ncbi:type III-A CRISPR-associated protein Csm2 [Streptococcus sp. KHUD_017]